MGHSPRLPVNTQLMHMAATFEPKPRTPLNSRGIDVVRRQATRIHISITRGRIPREDRRHDFNSLYPTRIPNHDQQSGNLQFKS